MAKRKNTYENDGITIEKQETTQPVAPAKQEYTQKRDVKFTVADVVDIFAGYLTPGVAVHSDNDTQPGMCMLCGKTTTKAIRKVCYSCLEKHAAELYKKAKNAIEMGDDWFTL